MNIVQVPERLLAGGAAFKDRNRRRMSLPASCRYLDTAAKKLQADSRRSSIASICSTSCETFLTCYVCNCISM
jgi:hypothetical protein